MKQNPQITVVTVCYNAEKEIEATMRSVLNQTYENIEYIIVDGASKDDTLNIINRVASVYKDRQIKIKSEPDKGIYDAMNKAIDMASGEWINFMNAGDLFATSNAVSLMFNDLTVEASVFFGNTIHKKGSALKLVKGHLNENEFPHAGHQATFVKASLMKQYHFDTSYKICADFNFLYKLYTLSHAFYYKDVDVSIYDTSGLSSQNRERLYLERCRIKRIKHRKLFVIKCKIEDSMPKWLMDLVYQLLGIV